MKIPSISESFAAMFTGPSVTVDETLKHNGKPIFVKEDVTAARSALDRIIRFMFVKEQITYEYFMQRCRKYALEILAVHPTKANSTGCNLLRALKKGDITWNRFEEAIVMVLGNRIEDVVVVLTSELGEHKEYGYRNTFNS